MTILHIDLEIINLGGWKGEFRYSENPLPLIFVGSYQPA